MRPAWLLHFCLSALLCIETGFASVTAPSLQCRVPQAVRGDVTCLRIRGGDDAAQNRNTFGILEEEGSDEEVRSLMNFNAMVSLLV